MLHKTLLLASLLATSLHIPAFADDAANVETAKRVFLEKLGQGRFDKLDSLYSPDFISHSAAGDFDLEADNRSAKMWRDGIPDLKIGIARTVAGSDMVAVHWMARGTNTVQALGMPGKGARIDMEGMTFFRFSAGRIVEEWTLLDMATFTKQVESVK